jgi:hypothetical protein
VGVSAALLTTRVQSAAYPASFCNASTCRQLLAILPCSEGIRTPTASIRALRSDSEPGLFRNALTPVYSSCTKYLSLVQPFVCVSFLQGDLTPGLARHCVGLRARTCSRRRRPIALQQSLGTEVCRMVGRLTALDRPLPRYGISGLLSSNLLFS